MNLPYYDIPVPKLWPIREWSLITGRGGGGLQNGSGATKREGDGWGPDICLNAEVCVWGGGGGGGGKGGGRGVGRGGGSEGSDDPPFLGGKFYTFPI